MFGGGGGRTRQKYRCKADGCQVTPMGVNLAKHYKVNTDWVLLKELKACTMGEQWLLKQFSLNHPVEHIQKPKLPKLYVRVETSTSYFIIHNQFVK